MTFIKWVGGKSKLINKILPLFPKTDDETIYIEPFIGSGAVLINFLETNPKLKKIIATDSNENLILTYLAIKKACNELLKELEILTNKYNSAENKEKFYYKQRDKYNNNSANDIKKTALFIFLNKTCFRGLYRVNKDNLFNVPYGNYKNPLIYDEEYIKHLSKLFNVYNVHFKTKSYDETLSNIKQNSKYLIYLDPPYLNTFDSYTCNKFDNDKFSKVIEETINKNKHNKIILSNSADFYDKYANLLPYCETFDIQDKINSRSPNSTRKEIIMHN